MQTADVSQDAPGMGSQANTKGLHAEFHMEAELDPVESEKLGRQFYREVEYVTIRIPGDKDNDIVRPVRFSDKQAWPTQYAAFKAGLEQPVSGTPLSQLPFLNKAQVLEFGAVGVRTAEQLVEMSDAVAQKFMGAHAIRKRVKDFLDAAAGAAPITAMRAEMDKRDNEIAVLKNALAEQGKKIEEMSKQRR
jgi:hypothetical protein